MRIDDLRNSCTLRAIKQVSHLPDDVIIAAFQKYGYKLHKGMTMSKVFAIAQYLGLQPDNYDTSNGKAAKYKAFTMVTRGGYTRRIVKRTQSPNYTVAQAAAKNPRGVFVLAAARHAFTLVHGKIGDTRKKRARVYSIIRIRNPYIGNAAPCAPSTSTAPRPARLSPAPSTLAISAPSS